MINYKKDMIETVFPFAKNISFINFAVTYLCNSRCKHCNIWKKYKKNSKLVKDELTLNEIKKIFESSQYLKHLKKINFTGGEPFLRKDIVDLCGFFINKFPKAGISIATNAIDTDMIVGRLQSIIENYNPDDLYISVSLDGTEKTHDEIRGVSNNYNQVIEFIKIIKKDFPSINQGISFTITPQNYKELLEVYKISKTFGVNFGPQFAHHSKSYYDNVKNEFKWDVKQLDDIRKMIDFILNDGIKTKNNTQSLLRIIGHQVRNIYYVSHMVDFQRNPRFNFKCYSGDHSFFMDPYGNIYPCIMLDKKIGNIRVNNFSFDKLWFSESAQKIRKWIKDNNCACWTRCETIPSLVRDPKILLWSVYKTLINTVSTEK